MDFPTMSETKAIWPVYNDRIFELKNKSGDNSPILLNGFR